MKKTLLILAVGSPLIGFHTAAASDLTVNVNVKTMTRMSSPWADYFGTHYARSPEEAGKTWNTVRDYGGTHVGICRGSGRSRSRGRDSARTTSSATT